MDQTNSRYPEIIYNVDNEDNEVYDKVGNDPVKEHSELLHGETLRLGTLRTGEGQEESDSITVLDTLFDCNKTEVDIKASNNHTFVFLSFLDV